jgi:hypothetical protein
MRERDSKRTIVRLGYQVIVVLVRFDVPIFLLVRFNVWIVLGVELIL